MSSANASLSGSESAELRPSLATAATLLFVSSLTIMAATVISPGLPAIEAHFAGTENAAFLTRLLITMPALAIAFIAPFAGKFTDRFGRLRVLSASVLLYGLAGTSGLIADTLYALLFGRALLGAAVAGIVTATTALIGDLFAGPSRDRFMGLQTAFTGIGGLLFMSFGGLLAGAGWRAPFAIYGLALLILPAVLLCLTEPRYERQDSGASGPARVPLLAVSVLLLAAVFNSICFYLIPTQMPFHLYALGVNSPGTVGITLGAFNLAVAAASLGYGRLRAMVGLPGGFAVRRFWRDGCKLCNYRNVVFARRRRRRAHGGWWGPGLHHAGTRGKRHDARSSGCPRPRRRCADRQHLSRAVPVTRCQPAARQLDWLCRGFWPHQRVPRNCSSACSLVGAFRTVDGCKGRTRLKRHRCWRERTELSRNHWGCEARKGAHPADFAR